MAEERIIDRLRRGEKILCPLCKKGYYDNSGKVSLKTNYFHCNNPECSEYVHEQNPINID